VLDEPVLIAPCGRAREEQRNEEEDADGDDERQPEHERDRAPADLDALLGRGERGTSRAAMTEYVDGIVAALANARPFLRRAAPVVIVVNDRRDLYPEILERAGLTLETRYRRHVNRRTGRRAGEFYEDVLVARV